MTLKSKSTYCLLFFLLINLSLYSAPPAPPTGWGKKGNLFDFIPLKSQYGQISPVLTFSGFRLNQITFNPPETCIEKLDYDFLFWSYFIIKNKLSLASYDNYLAKCKNKFSPNIKTILGQFSINDKSLDIEKSLDLIQFKQYIDRLKKKQSMGKVKGPDSNEYYYLLNQIKIFEKISPGILRNLVLTQIYLSVTNWGAARRMIVELINLDPKRVIFELDYIKDEKKIIEDLLFLINSFKDSIKEKMTFKLLLNYLGLFDYNDQFLDLKKDMDANWSLADIRITSQDSSLGKKYIGLWFYLLKEKSFMLEVEKFLLKNLKEKTIFNDSLWLFLYYFPAEGPYRDLIFKKVADKMKFNSLYDEYLLFELMESRSPIRNYVVKLNTNLARPLFNIKRDFYRKQLKQNQLIEFSLYNLYMLGERNVELLLGQIL